MWISKCYDMALYTHDWPRLVAGQLTTSATFLKLEIYVILCNPSEIKPVSSARGGQF